jgi:predicted kinase
MRKWMRERLQRRKKKTTEEAKQPAPPPLQPAYFDEGAEAPPESPSSDSAPAPEPQPKPIAETQATTDETSSEPSPEQRSKPRAAGGSRARSRRRRGGRGRGGQGREQTVARAFAPTGSTGVAPEPTEEAPEEGAAEVSSEGEVAAPVPQKPQVPAAVPQAPPRPPKGIVVLAIGLPGSGKSTWFKRHSISPLSSDMVRSLLFDDVREQRYQDLVFSNLRSMLKARLIAKRPMNYVDATNLTPQERQHWIKLAKDYNYEVHAVFFDVPLEVCIERHQRRDRVVPEDIMRRMAAKLKPPSFEEGFAKITVVRVKKKD